MALENLPENLPVPQDDGACAHLVGTRVPNVALLETSGERVSLRDLAAKRTVLYVYPMTGRPDRTLPDDWETIPGARGCTPQSCSFRDHHAELRGLGASVYGLSTQPSPYQREAKERLHLPFELLSDAELEFGEALGLPTLEVEELAALSPDIPRRLLKRVTLILSGGKIERVFYPVFPPDQNAADVLAYLRSAR